LVIIFKLPQPASVTAYTIRHEPFRVYFAGQAQVILYTTFPPGYRAGVIRTLRKRAIATWRPAELQHLGFEFADVTAQTNELLNITPSLLLQPLKIIVLRTCRNLKVAVLAFKFLYPIAAFTATLRRRFWVNAWSRACAGEMPFCSATAIQ
jgi:hypothetical protein